jgi:hypothetical protein
MIRTLSEAGVLYNPPDYNLDDDTMVFLIKDYINYSIDDIRADLPTPLYIDPGCTPDKEIAEIIGITNNITSALHSAVNDTYVLVPPKKPVPAAYVKLKNNSQILVLALFYKGSGGGGKRKKPTKKRRHNRRRMTRRYRKKNMR